jgi:hypothetical protein
MLRKCLACETVIPENAHPNRRYCSRSCCARSYYANNHERILAQYRASRDRRGNRYDKAYQHDYYMTVTKVKRELLRKMRKLLAPSTYND